MTDHNIEARRRWAHAMIGQVADPAAPYGSPQWIALPEGDIRKIVGVVIAAESWARDGDELGARLLLECEATRLADKRAEDADYAADIAAGQERWRHLRGDNPKDSPFYIPRKLERGDSI